MPPRTCNTIGCQCYIAFVAVAAVPPQHRLNQCDITATIAIKYFSLRFEIYNAAKTFQQHRSSQCYIAFVAVITTLQL
ncbi:hypothetical protein Acr_17g0006750 [Actinidia rufa]|uniref:Uncharacterized protein n=1 Tax=Actinidia rufa TaxID=165716 RepID=A0A7J0G2U6_9ERIC|nr:hypothetical protein Acr_17g0006750 [Actinidia rufa]